MIRDGQRSRVRLGGLVRRHREAAGLTQRQLADATGVSLGAVRDLEQGRTTRPHPWSVAQLTAALGLGLRQRDALLSLWAAAAPPARPAAAAGRHDRPGHRQPIGSGVGGLQLCLLGPLVVWRDGTQVALRTDRQRTVLGLLALHIGTGVHRDAIVDALWGEDPPASAMTIVQSQVSRLRRMLDPGRPARAGGVTLTRAGTSYQLPAGVRSDAGEFTELAGRAREAAAAGDLAGACERFERALGLWRGEPLADVDALRAHPAVTELSGQRAAAVLAYAEVAAGAGRDEQVVGHLRALAARDPLNERAHARLMAALAATGQQAAALGIFEELRHRLITELGVRPGPELADTQMMILCQNVPATRSAAITPVPGHPHGPQLVPPRQLPPAVPFFAGRHAELHALTGLLDRVGDETKGTVVISVIGGTAGVGKTALAVHWAHRIAARFPDGQLWVNLRGYDAGQPMPAAEALAGFLRALGVADQDVPADTDERAALYRSLLAERRMLVVLDNAGSVEQVRPLLPGASACAVVVTSRDSLAALVARDGARRVNLNLLPLKDAVGLLRALIGERVDASPEAAAVLAAQCVRLPLPLRVVAELAAARPAAPLAELVSELADQQRRLDLLEAGGDPRTAVRAVFSWSYRHLDAGAARAFRVLGLHPGSDVDHYAAAALTGTTVERARRLLDLLARAHLIQPAGPGRYGMHDLLRAYARELGAAQDGADERRAALTRLFDHYLHTAATAMDTLVPAEHNRRPRIPPPGTPAPPATGRPDTARAWLDAERANLVSAAAHSADHGWPGHTTRLAATLYRYLDIGGHYAEAITIHTHARRAAHHTADRADEAEALTNLGAVDVRQGRYQQASGYFQQALALYLKHGDRTGEARALGNLGDAEFQRGHYQQAIDYLQQALALFRKTGERTGEAYALTHLGDVDLRQGRYQHASDHQRQALGLSRQIGDRSGEAEALNGLGEVLLAAGRPGDARTQHSSALDLASRIGDQEQQARAHNGLASSYRAASDHGQARRHWQEALTRYTDLGAPEADQVRAKLTAADDQQHREP